MHYFDVYAGTSTGSLLACALASGMSTAHVIGLYQQHGQKLFHDTNGVKPPQGHRYDIQALQNLLQDSFGARRLLDLAKRTLVSCYDKASQQPLLLDNQNPLYAGLPISSACLASSALPGLFPPQFLNIIGRGVCELVDGGVYDTNPAAQAIATLAASSPDILQQRFVLASLGTGCHPRLQQDQLWPQAPDDVSNLLWMQPRLHALLDHHLDIQMLRDGLYYRLQIALPDELASPDLLDKTAIPRLIQLSQQYLSGHGGVVLTQLAERLRQSRPQLAVVESTVPSI
jgi:predicted acylesterase/phospholipase RssA